MVRRRGELRPLPHQGGHHADARQDRGGRVQQDRRRREARRGRRPLRELIHDKGHADRAGQRDRPRLGLPAVLPRRGPQARPEGHRLDDDLPDGHALHAPGARLPRRPKVGGHDLPAEQAPHGRRQPDGRHQGRRLEGRRVPQPRASRSPRIRPALHPRDRLELRLRRLCPRLLPLPRQPERLLRGLEERFRGVHQVQRHHMARRRIHLRRRGEHRPRNLLQAVVGVPLDDHPRLRGRGAPRDQGTEARREARILGRLVVGSPLRQRAELGKQHLHAPRGHGVRLLLLLVFEQLLPHGIRRGARHLPARNIPRAHIRRRRQRIGGVRNQPRRAHPAQRLHLLRDGAVRRPGL